ncbi:MAG: hypothetical protein H7X77_08915 [Anaerolineae bacterium]|nr:hypothetical protein [Anaerolineae bacterium]
MKLFYLFLSLFALLLTACGANSTPATNLPANATGVTPGDFRITVSGDLTTQLTGQALAQSSSPASPDQSLTLVLFAAGAADAPARGVTVVMPADIASGTYPIKSYYSVFDSTGLVTGVGALFSEPGSADNPANLFDASSGELQLTSLNPVSGSLNFNTSSPEMTLTVEGVFNDVPLIAAP